MTTAGRVALGVGIGMLGMPPPLVGQLAGGVVALAVRLRGLVNRGMLDPRPVLIATLVSFLPFAPACGDDSGTTTEGAFCNEPEFVSNAWMDFATCGCNNSSPWFTACTSAGNTCTYDTVGSICQPRCKAADNSCVVHNGVTPVCSPDSGLCTLPCDGGPQDTNCPFGLVCSDESGATCLAEYGDPFP